MIVYVESKVLADTAIAGDESFGAVIQKFCTFREGEETTSHQRTGLYWLVHTVALLFTSENE